MKLVHATITAALTASLAAAALAAGATTASAQGGGGGAKASGSCSASSTWKIKAKPDDARIQVELEVDSNVVGQRWNVTLTDNATTVFKGKAVTVAPSGSFTVSRRTANQGGVDAFVGKATNPATGETCTARVSL